MSKLRSDEIVNKEGTGGPSFPQGVTSSEPTEDNHVATKSYVDASASFHGGNTFSPTAPTNPAIGSFWTDTSASPCTLKVWDGTIWIEFSSDVNYTGSFDTPLEVFTPFEGDGVPYDYTPQSDVILSKYGVFQSGLLDQTSEIGLLKNPRDYVENSPQEIIVNGGFDNYFNNWTQGGSSPNFGRNTSISGADGAAAILGNSGSDLAQLYQSFTTVVGQQYDVSFDHQYGPEVKVWDGNGISGTVLTSIATTNTYNSSMEIGATGTFTATSTTSTIGLDNIPNQNYTWRIDRISVKESLPPDAIGSTEGSSIVGSAFGKGTYVLLSYDEGVAYSTDEGVTWQTSPLPDADTTWNKIIYTGDDNFGGRFVAVGNTPTKQFMWSDDGITWTLGTGTIVRDAYNNPDPYYTDTVGVYVDLDIDPSSGRIVAAGIAPKESFFNWRSPYMYSDDGGETWTRNEATHQNWQGKGAIAYGNGIWIAPSFTNHPDEYNAKNYPEWSLDGITWYVANNSSQGNKDDLVCESIVFNADSNEWVAPGWWTEGSRQSRIFLSTDSSSNMTSNADYLTWGGVSSYFGSTDEYGDETQFSKLAYGNGVYILATRGIGASTQRGYRTSNDARSWSGVQYLPGRPGGRGDLERSKITSVEFIDGRFVIACADGEVFLSEKGLSFGTIPEFSTGKQTKDYAEFLSANIFKKTDGTMVPNFELSDLFAGKTAISSDSGLTVDMLDVTGNVVNISSMDHVVVGERLHIDELLTYGLDPNIVKFTSRNKYTPPVSATDATLAFRRWTLESRTSPTDPWTLVTVENDYSPVIDQDGLVPWANKPTLQPNTYYRVKVEYHSANADPIESGYQTFQTGAIGAGISPSTTGILIEDSQIVNLVYTESSVEMVINLVSDVYADEFDLDIGDFIQITDSPLTFANGIFPIIGRDGGPDSGDTGYIRVELRSPATTTGTYSWEDSAYMSVKTRVMAETLGYQMAPIFDGLISSIQTSESSVDILIRLASGVFADAVDANVGDYVRIAGLGASPSVMDPTKTASKFSLSNGNLTVTSDSDGWDGSYVASTISPNTGTWYWEVSNNSDEVGVIGFTFGLEADFTSAGDFWGSTGVWRVFFSTSSSGSLLNIVGNGDSSQIPTFGGETIGFEYNSDNGLMKITFDGVEVFSGNVSYAAQSRENYIMYSNYGSGLEVTFAFAPSDWQYGPSGDANYLADASSNFSIANGDWRITHINDDSSVGPDVHVHTFMVNDPSNNLNHQHLLGSTSTTGTFHWGRRNTQVYLPNETKQIRVGAEPGVWGGIYNGSLPYYETSRLYAIYIDGVIVNENSPYFGTVTSTTAGLPGSSESGWIMDDIGANAVDSAGNSQGVDTHATAYPIMFEGDGENPLAYGQTLWTNYGDMGEVVFTPNIPIPAGSRINIRTNDGNKITFVSDGYAPHDGAVITARLGAPAPSNMQASWPSTGSMTFASLTEFAAHDNSESSGGSSSGSSSGSSGGSSGGGY